MAASILLWAALAVSPEPIALGKQSVDLVIEPSARAASAASVHAWALAGLRAVTSYLGAFPIDHVQLEVVSGPGKAINGHSVFGPDGRTHVTVQLGREVGEGELRKDWVLVHELVHLAFPGVAPRFHWIEEGLATYVEPLVRVQDQSSGFGATVPDVWRQLLEGLPRGMAADAHGLDRAHSWATTYWGGALYWLRVDLDLRERTGGRCSVQDALHGLGRSGLSMATPLPLPQVLAAADRATGMDSFARLYSEMGPKLTPFDLDGLLRSLGVSEADGQLQLDDRAPRAALRRAITAPSAGTCQPQAPVKPPATTGLPPNGSEAGPLNR